MACMHAYMHSFDNKVIISFVDTAHRRPVLGRGQFPLALVSPGLAVRGQPATRRTRRESSACLPPNALENIATDGHSYNVARTPDKGEQRRRGGGGGRLPGIDFE